MRSLSNRLSALQKEMNPQVNVSGGTLSSSRTQYVTRKYATLVSLSSGTHTVTTGDSGLPDGCKVLKVVAKNLTGRYLVVTVPYDTPLVLPSAEGTSGNPFGGIKKYKTAPTTRLPTIKVQVPDLLASPLETTTTTTPLFTVGAMAASSDTVEIVFTVRYAL